MRISAVKIPCAAARLPACLPSIVSCWWMITGTGLALTPLQGAFAARTNQRAVRCLCLCPHPLPLAGPGFSLFLLLCVGQLILWHKFSVNSFGQLRPPRERERESEWVRKLSCQQDMAQINHVQLYNSSMSVYSFQAVTSCNSIIEWTIEQQLPWLPQCVLV